VLGLRPEQAPELGPERVVAERELAGAALELQPAAGPELRPEQVAAGPERAEAGALGAGEQLIARMVKRNLRSALGVWF
jgi:hypothetical protein